MGLRYSHRNILSQLWKSLLNNWGMKVKVKVTQSCLTLCDPVDGTVHGILQASIREWVAFPFSRGSSQPRNRTQVSSIAGGFFTSWATREAQTLGCYPGNASSLILVTQTHLCSLSAYVSIIEPMYFQMITFFILEIPGLCTELLYL